MQTPRGLVKLPNNESKDFNGATAVDLRMLKFNGRIIYKSLSFCELLSINSSSCVNSSLKGKIK